MDNEKTGTYKVCVLPIAYQSPSCTGKTKPRVLMAGACNFSYSLRSTKRRSIGEEAEDHDNGSSSTAFSSHKVSTAALHSTLTMTASSYTVAAVACLSVGGAMTSTQAFSPPRRTQTTIANCRLPRVRHTMVPTSSFHSHQSCQIILQNMQHKSTSLKSAIEETIETTSPEAFSSENDSLHNEEVNTPELLTSLDTTTSDTTPSSAAPQELKTVLSSPELLDPISILNATLPSLTETEKEEELGISTTSSGVTLHSTTLDGDNVENTNAVESIKKKKLSKEEDLELTVLAILRHIDDISSADSVVDDDEDDEEGEHLF